LSGTLEEGYTDHSVGWKITEEAVPWLVRNPLHDIIEDNKQK
jgi:hypothetical protein